MSGFDVIVCGSLHLDIVVHSPRLPALDETIAGTRWAFACGGKGRNQAVQAAASGACVAMIGRVGMDDFGSTLLASLDHAEIDRSAVGADPALGSGMSIATVTPQGDYAAVIVSGANLAHDPREVAGQVAALGPAPWLLLQNEIGQAVNEAAARAMREAGGRVILNAAPARLISPELDALVDILVVNRVEAEQLCGIGIERREDAVVAARRLARADRAVVVTLGAGGLILLSGGSAPVAIAAEPVSVVSTHGAGDCFVGTLATQLSSGVELQAACRAANIAAARFVSGAFPST